MVPLALCEQNMELPATYSKFTTWFLSSVQQSVVLLTDSAQQLVLPQRQGSFILHWPRLQFNHCLKKKIHSFNTRVRVSECYSINTAVTLQGWRLFLANCCCCTLHDKATFLLYLFDRGFIIITANITFNNIFEKDHTFFKYLQGTFNWL